MSTQPYTVRFEYADGQQYDSGIVHMTTEQAGKIETLLNALAKDEQLSDPYVGGYQEWETPLAELMDTLETEFSPEESGDPEIIDAWADAVEVSKDLSHL